MSASLLSQQVEVALQRSLADAVSEPHSAGVSCNRGSGNGGSGNDSDASAMTCSICLQHPALEQIASVKGCDHAYCVKCILRWAAHCEQATCPQCKLPFDTVTTYQQLDGSLWDFPYEESVVLLKRAHWFTDFMQEVEKGSAWRVSADDGGAGFADYNPYYQEYDDVEEVEDYYFSAAAGRARIVLGNRRLGENGFIASGRRQARPARQQTSGGPKKKGGASTAAPSPTPSPSAARSASRATHTSREALRASAATPASAYTLDGNNRDTSLSTAPASTPAAHTSGSGGGNSRVSSMAHASNRGSIGNSRGLPPSLAAAAAGTDRLRQPQLRRKAPAASHSDRLAADEAPSTSAAPEKDNAHTASSSRAGHVAGSPPCNSSRAIPLRSNRRPGGAPATSSYRPLQQHQHDKGCQHGAGTEGGVAACGSSPLGSSPCSGSPLGSSPGYGSSRGSGRRAKRNLRRTLDDEMGALHT